MPDSGLDSINYIKATDADISSLTQCNTQRTCATFLCDLYT